MEGNRDARILSVNGLPEKELHKKRNQTIFIYLKPLLERALCKIQEINIS